MSQAAQRTLSIQYFRGLRPGKLLDAPCGTLWLDRALAPLGFECHAADLQLPVESPTGVTLHSADLNARLPFDDETFDYAACIEGVEHVESMIATIRELGRVLKPGGRLLVTTPNVLTVKSRLRYLLRGRYYGFPHLIGDIPRTAHAHLSPAPLPSLDFAAWRAELRREQILPYPVRTSDRVYLPIAWIYRLAHELESAFGSKESARRALLADLASEPLLLGETLMVSYRKLDRQPEHGRDKNRDLGPDTSEPNPLAPFPGETVGRASADRKG